jgi:hypothetical protein
MVALNFILTNVLVDKDDYTAMFVSGDGCMQGYLKASSQWECMQ